MAKNPPSAGTGHNQPALSHEHYAQQAERSYRTGEKASLKGAAAIIMALTIAEQHEVCGPGYRIADQWRKRGRAMDLSPIFVHVFGLKAREDDTYRTLGGLRELEREYKERGEPVPPEKAARATEQDNLVMALSAGIRRNLRVVALLTQHGGAYHAQEAPQGVVDFDEKSGRLRLRQELWFDATPSSPGKMSNRSLWEERAGGPMSKEQREAWVTLDGSRQFEGKRNLSALQKLAARHLEGTPERAPRVPRMSPQAFTEAVAKQDPDRKTLSLAAMYISTTLARGNHLSNEQRDHVLEMVPTILSRYCTTEDGELDLAKVRALYEHELEEVAA